MASAAFVSFLQEIDPALQFIEFIHRGGLQFREDFRVLGGEHGEKMLGADAGGGDVLAAFGEAARRGGAFADERPFHVAAPPPLSDILLRDEFAVEVRVQDGEHRGIGIEPFDEEMRGIAFEKAGVQFLADGEREPGDFAESGFHSDL